jgi:hypothetical protein
MSNPQIKTFLDLTFGFDLKFELCHLTLLLIYVSNHLWNSSSQRGLKVI